jgi:hypothetical protein
MYKTAILAEILEYKKNSAFQKKHLFIKTAYLE